MFRFLAKIFILLLFVFETICPSYSKCDNECQKTQNKTFVSISPAMTEIMYAIGAKNSLTAVSNYCTYPEDAKKKEKIGSNYSINYEKIIKLKPDYLLALDISEGLVSKVRRFGITPLCFKYPNIESIYQNILEVGKLTGKIKESREVVEFSKQKITAANIRNKKNAGKKILYLVQVQPMIAIGNKSFITDIIEKSGNYSVTSGLSSFYPVISEEYAIKTKPDIVVLSFFSDDSEVKRFFPNAKIIKMTKEQNDIINRPGPRVYKSVEFFSSL